MSLYKDLPGETNQELLARPGQDDTQSSRKLAAGGPQPGVPAPRHARYKAGLRQECALAAPGIRAP